MEELIVHKFLQQIDKKPSLSLASLSSQAWLTFRRGKRANEEFHAAKPPTSWSAAVQ